MERPAHPESQGVPAKSGDRNVQLVVAKPRLFDFHVVDAATTEPVRVFWYACPWVSRSMYIPSYAVPVSLVDGGSERWCIVKGFYELAVWAPGYAVSQRSITVTEDRSPISLEIALERGVTLTGRAFQSGPKGLQGVPFANVSLGYRKDTWPLPLAATFLGAPNGVFRLPNQKRTEQTIAVSAPGFAEESHSIDLSGDSIVNVTLLRGATVHGRVTRRDGSALANVWVRLGPPEGSPPPSRSGPTVQADLDGAFRFESVHPGKYTVEFMGANVPPGWNDKDDPNYPANRPIELAPGEDREINDFTESKPSKR